MKITIITSFLLIGFAFCVKAQTSKSKAIISGRINLDDRFELVMIPKEKKEGTDESIYSAISKDGKFSVQIPITKQAFWNFVILPKAKDRQLAINFPLFIKPGTNEKINLQYNDTTYLSVNDNSKITGGNQALILYSNFRSVEQRGLFFQPPILDSSKNYLMQFPGYSTQLIRQFKVKEQQIKNFLKVWSLNDYVQNLQNLEQLFSGKGIKSLPTEIYEYPKLNVKQWNFPEALLLAETNASIKKYIAIIDKNNEVATTDPAEALKHKLKIFNQQFTNKKLRLAINSGLLQEYIRNVKFSTDKDFEDKVIQFTSLASVISDSTAKKALIQNFSNLKFTRTGAQMPDVQFIDANGREVNFQSFKGKYVYIDMWASWCVPCIKEIPYLKQLEKDYAEKNIVFISISVDEDKEAWKKKMKDLNLTGHQLEVGNSGFEKMMNMQGIPHFILYTPEGKLMLYKAPRPSSLEIRKIFDSI